MIAQNYSYPKLEICSRYSLSLVARNDRSAAVARYSAPFVSWLVISDGTVLSCGESTCKHCSRSLTAQDAVQMDAARQRVRVLQVAVALA